MNDWPAILKVHGPAVWRTVYRLLNHDADAHDCYQDTFLAACQCAEREVVSDWRAFLVSLGARKAMDRLRRRYRERGRGVAIDAVGERESGAPSPVQFADAADMLGRVRECLAEMPEQQAQVFWLCCVEGLSHEQVGERLGMTPGAARVVLHRARAHLRGVLSVHAPTD